MKLLDYRKPETLEEAMDLYKEKDGVIIAGGAWLKLGNLKKEVGIDMDHLGLSYIKENDDGLVIGAMTSLYDLEFSPLVAGYGSGILSKSASLIMGVQVRSIATLGGTVCGKYGFSDLIPSLLALDARLRFYQEGVMTLEDYLSTKGRIKDILVEVIIPKKIMAASFETFKKTSIDFAVLNVALAVDGDNIRIVVGARPGGAKLVVKSLEEVKKVYKDHQSLHDLAQSIADAYIFGTNHRGSKEYRRQLAIALIADGMKEVLK